MGCVNLMRDILIYQDFEWDGERDPQLKQATKLLKRHWFFNVWSMQARCGSFLKKKMKTAAGVHPQPPKLRINFKKVWMRKHVFKYDEPKRNKKMFEEKEGLNTLSVSN